MSDERKIYTKKPLSIDEQVALLKSRGLQLPSDDEDLLRYYLHNVNYYHLSIYFKFFQNNDTFTEGTTFSEVLSVYIFDNKLRQLLLELLERLEKALKCRITYTLTTNTNDPHCFLNQRLFYSDLTHQEIINMFNDEFKKNSRETSIYHYKNTYKEPGLPPLWSIIELLSFGQTVKLFKSLSLENKNIISRTFNIDETLLSSWMHGLSVIRNHCAHHSRLWNRDLTLKPKVAKTYKEYFVDNNRLFNQFIILQIILNNVNPDSSWKDRLIELIREYKILPKNMGFPDDWEAKMSQIIKF